MVTLISSPEKSIGLVISKAPLSPWRRTAPPASYKPFDLERSKSLSVASAETLRSSEGALAVLLVPLVNESKVSCSTVVHLSVSCAFALRERACHATKAKAKAVEKM